MSRSILIVEDHKMIANAFAAMLKYEAGYEIVGICHNGADALATIDAAGGEIDVIVSDLYLPGHALGEPLAEMRRRAPNARIICVTSSMGLQDERIAMDSGADLVIRKHEAADLLVAACSGEQKPKAPSDRSEAMISPRQIDVLKGLAQGKSNKQIAIDLGVSPETVKSHISELLRRAGAAGRGELVFWARKNGVLLDA